MSLLTQIAFSLLTFLPNWSNGASCGLCQTESDCLVDTSCIFANDTCQCSSVQDIIFVADESGSVTVENWPLVKSFMANVTQDGISLDSRIGIITYSTGSILDYSLSASQSRSTIVSTINGLGFTGGVTRTELAVNAAIAEFDANPSSNEKILVLITDGIPTDSPCTTVNDLASRDIYVIIVAVGDFDVSDVLCLIESPSEGIVTEVTSFDVINEVVPSIDSIICGVDIDSDLLVEYANGNLASDSTIWQNTGSLGSSVDLEGQNGASLNPFITTKLGIQSLCVNSELDDFIYIDVDTNEDELPNLTFVTWLYQGRQPTGLDWILSHDDGGFDRSIILSDTRYNGISAGTGSPYQSNIPYLDLCEWTFVAVSYNLCDKTATIYRGTASDATPVSQKTSTTSQNLSVIKRIVLSGNPSFGNHKFVGCFGQVEIHGKALTLVEITQKFNSFKTTINGVPPLTQNCVTGLSKGTFGNTDLGITEFNNIYYSDPFNYIVRECTDCDSDDHKTIYYKRLTGSFNTYVFDIYSSLANSWTNIDNQNQVDFKLYSNVNNLNDDCDPWQFCNYGNVLQFGGFRDCGPDGLRAFQIGNFNPPSGRANVKFSICNPFTPPQSLPIYQEFCVTGFSRGSFGIEDIGATAFNDYYYSNPNNFIKRECEDCNSLAHKNIYYRRLTMLNQFDIYTSVTKSWTATSNQNQIDFKLYSNLVNIINDQKPWTFCNYGNVNQYEGFRDCSPSSSEIQAFQINRANLRWSICNQNDYPTRQYVYDDRNMQYIFQQGVGKTYSEALDICENLVNKELASIINQNELETFRNLLISTQETREVWIGYNRVSTTDFVWSDGSEVGFEPWLTGFPQADDCVAAACSPSDPNAPNYCENIVWVTRDCNSVDKLIFCNDI